MHFFSSHIQSDSSKKTIKTNAIPPTTYQGMYKQCLNNLIVKLLTVDGYISSEKRMKPEHLL